MCFFTITTSNIFLVNQVLYPRYHSKDLRLWDAVYRSCPLGGTDEPLPSPGGGTQPLHPNDEGVTPGDLVKTRSCDDLSQSPTGHSELVRHASDSNLTVSDGGNLRDSAPNLAMLSSALGSEILGNEHDSESIEMSSLNSRFGNTTGQDMHSAIFGCNGGNRRQAAGVQDTDVDRTADLLMETLRKDYELTENEVTGADSTLEKLLPVCRCIEVEERKRTTCNNISNFIHTEDLSVGRPCNNSSNFIHTEDLNVGRPCGNNSGRCISLQQSVVTTSRLPTEIKGIPEASKKTSEVAFEISKGNIEAAVEANESNLATTCDEDRAEYWHQFPHCVPADRMFKSDSDVGATFSHTLSDQLQQQPHHHQYKRGSTDTLVASSDDTSCCCCYHYDSDCKQQHLLQLRKQHRLTTSCNTNGFFDDDKIVDHLMRTKFQQQASASPAAAFYCYKDNYRCLEDANKSASNSCSICLQSSKLLSDLDNVVNPATAAGLDSRRNSTTVVSTTITSSTNITTTTSSCNMVASEEPVATFTASVLSRYLFTNTSSNSQQTSTVAASNSSSRAASSKSTPGHSRTPSLGFGAEHERSV